MGTRGELMDEFWKGIIYKNPEAKHVCNDFSVILACNGENDIRICRKCGNAWITPCSNKGEPRKEQNR
jgi:hypothetical protein